jgi:ABC-2 type transport system ATP-binding protein
MCKIEMENITKIYGNLKVLNNISLKLEANKIYGLLGRNGAGKSTILNIITNKIFVNTGSVLIDGENAFTNNQVQNKIFHMMVDNIFPFDMKVSEGIKWTNEFYPNFNRDYAYELLDKFGLESNKRIKSLSTGYISIYKLIVALASEATIIIFDEPVLGLDPHHRILFYEELIKNHCENPKTIVLSTHLIDEITNILEKIIIIATGNIIFDGSLEELLNSVYSASGDNESIEKYIMGKKVIKDDSLGNYRAVHIQGNYNKVDRSLINKLNINVLPISLQELFISITSQ